MRQVLIALMLVTGCGAGADQANNSAGDAGGSVASAAGLTGLYEAGAPRPNQLCVVDRGSGDATFGLVVWGGNMHSCSGSGSIAQDGNKLTLAMAGDQSCTIEATISGGTVTLPASVPEGCAYYCGARARLGGATFEKKGGTAADAMKAVDLVGEPLCGGEAAAR